jgi:hypothetical protein
MANVVVARIQPHCGDTSDPATTSCKYLNNVTLELPKWYLRFRGHALEDAIKEAFPSLRAAKNTNQLQSLILSTIVDDSPTLLSEDFLSVFLELQNLRSSQ